MKVFEMTQEELQAAIVPGSLTPTMAGGSAVDPNTIPKDKMAYLTALLSGAVGPPNDQAAYVVQRIRVLREQWDQVQKKIANLRRELTQTTVAENQLAGALDEMTVTLAHWAGDKPKESK